MILQRFATLLFLLATVCLASGVNWHFLPNFQCDVRGVEKPAQNGPDVFNSLPASVENLLSADSPLTDSQRDELYWHTADFPHRDFVNLMPERNVYGWYGCLFDIPEDLRGMDVLADLGIIDDTDEAFVNGVRIGGTGTVGKSHGTAWQTERLYRIPAGKLAPHSNYMAVHVWSLWGLGGIVGPPVLKAAIAPQDAQWELAFIKDSAASRDGLNTAADAESAVAAAAGGEALEWTKAPMPWKGFAAWPEDVHYAVFRLKFDMRRHDGTPRLPSAPVVMDVGPVFDVAGFYLNGRRVGLTGRFPENGEPAFTEAAQRGRFIVFPEDWSPDGHDELVAVVYRECGVGGLPGVPGLPLRQPFDGDGRASVQTFQEFQDLVQAFVQSGQNDTASDFLATTAEAWNMNEAEQAWLLSHRAHLAFLKWRDCGKKDETLLNGILAPMAEILAKYPVESPKQSAMQAFCRVLRLAEKDEELLGQVRSRLPHFAESCVLLPPDTETLGNWKKHYGKSFHVLAAMGQKCDWTGGEDWHLYGYELKIPGNRDVSRLWLPASQRKSSQSSALVMPRAYGHANLGRKTDDGISSEIEPELLARRAAWWDDHGEMHPFDDEGPDLLLDLKLPAASHLAAVYLQDYDWSHSLHPRQQSCILLDEAGHFLNAAWSGKLGVGAYVRFRFSELQKLQIRFCKHRGACVSVGGLFLDSIVGPKPINLKGDGQ